MSAMPNDPRPAAWELADRRAGRLNMDPPSERAWLVEHMAWGMHSTQQLGSPRQAWIAMDDSERATIYLRAAGALNAHDRFAEFEPETS